jgi:hypothetical protein
MWSSETTVFWDYTLEITISLWRLGQSGQRHRVGLGTRLEQSAIAPSHAHTQDECSHPTACCPSPLPVYARLRAFIFISSLLEGVEAGHSPCLVWLAALDVSYGRCFIAPRGQHPWAQAGLFSLLPLLRGRVRAWAGQPQFFKFF